MKPMSNNKPTWNSRPGGIVAFAQVVVSVLFEAPAFLCYLCEGSERHTHIHTERQRRLSLPSGDHIYRSKQQASCISQSEKGVLHASGEQSGGKAKVGTHAGALGKSSWRACYSARTAGNGAHGLQSIVSSVNEREHAHIIRRKAIKGHLILSTRSALLVLPDGGGHSQFEGDMPVSLVGERDPAFGNVIVSLHAYCERANVQLWTWSLCVPN